MKILYIKNNSERNSAYQLKTLIYEEGGQKYIVKEALSKEAIPFALAEFAALMIITFVPQLTLFLPSLL